MSGDPQLVKSAISQMIQAIDRDPTRSINQIYEDVQLSFTESMSMEERKSFLQEFPTFKNVQRTLYKKRREMIPRNPATMKELQIDLPWFLTDQKENLVKGDRVFDDGRRVILLTTNDLLEILAKAPQILGDGTFRITPTQWYQTFIISVQVSSGVFVPVCFALLPDKRRESYDAMFTMLKEALESRQLELSATFFMSDFECAIRDSFVMHFPEIEPKGCYFHYSKGIISKVAWNGFKGDYTSKKNLQFSQFIQAILGLGYIPLPRLREGIRNLFILARRLVGRQRKFAKKMIEYVSK